MKFQAMLKILFTLLKKRKVSATELAAACGVSERSIHRYLEELIVSGVPIDILRGRNGGIFLPDTYKLPENFFTKEEYGAAVNALSALYEQLHDPDVKNALEKLLSQKKESGRNLALSGLVVVDSGTWGDAYEFSDKLKVLEDAAENAECLDLLYVDRIGSESRRTIEPHLLIYKQNIWYVYAWCRKRKDFRLFKVGRIRSARLTGEKFDRREIDRSNLPLKFYFENAELTQIRFAVKKRLCPTWKNGWASGTSRSKATRSSPRPPCQREKCSFPKFSASATASVYSPPPRLPKKYKTAPTRSSVHIKKRNKQYHHICD